MVVETFGSRFRFKDQDRDHSGPVSQARLRMIGRPGSSMVWSAIRAWHATLGEVHYMAEFWIWTAGGGEMTSGWPVNRELCKVKKKTWLLAAKCVAQLR